MPKHLQFADVAQTLLDNGYELLPLHGKRPMVDDWSLIRVSQDHVDEWLKKYARKNVGIQTRYTPAVDVDVYDEEAANEMRDWMSDEFSDAPLRVGQAPKCLFLFRTREPFKKMKVTYVDANGAKHAVEILGEGQQFAAYGIHPDT